MKKIYSKIQPAHGDTILLCGHGNEKHALFSDSLEFQRPDKTFGMSSWIVLCESCYIQFCLNGEKPNVRRDAIWKGNEPEFYKIFD